MNLRLSSYNIRLCLEQGVDAVAHEIRSLAPDIIALQEVGMFWRMGPPGDLTKQLAARSGLHHHIFVPALYHEDGAYGIALLSKHPIVEHEKIELPQRDDEQRVLSRALLHLDGDSPVEVWTSHFSIATWDRAEQLRFIAGLMNERLPDFFLGDINTEPCDPLLKDWTLSNAWSVTPQKTYPSKEPASTLDSIFCSNRWSVAAQTSITETLASDHFPISAVFSPSEEDIR